VGRSRSLHAGSKEVVPARVRQAAAHRQWLRTTSGR
jgi:hypothetical protein